MDKENGKNSENATNKMPNSADSLLDAASLFGAYWTRGDSGVTNASSGTSVSNAAATSNLFAAAAAAGVYHPLMGPMGILPPALAAAAAAAAAVSSPSTISGSGTAHTAGTTESTGPRGGTSNSIVTSSAYSVPSSSGNSGASHTVSSSAVTTAAYNNAYTNTLSAAASQAASLQGMSAWWSMAQQFAAHDYVTRMQASALNIPGRFMGNPAALSDPYAAVAALSLSAATLGSGSVSSSHKGHSSKGSAKSRNSGKNQYISNKQQQQQQQLQLEQLHMLNAGKNHSSSGNSSWRKRERDRDKYSSLSMDHKKLSIRELDLMSAYGMNLKDPSTSKNFKDSSSSINRLSSVEKNIYSSSLPLSTGGNFMLEKELAAANHHLQHVAQQSMYGYGKHDKQGDRGQTNAIAAALAAASAATTVGYSTPTTSDSSNVSNSTLSDPHTILGGVRLPPDTEIIKYTSSIVGPKIPGTTNRGRKKTISLDHGSTTASAMSPLMHPQQHHAYQHHPALAAAMAAAVSAASIGCDAHSPAQQPVAAHASSGGGSSLTSIQANLLMDTRNAKRPKLDIMDGDPNPLGNDSVEVIKLPSKGGSPLSMASYNNYSDGSGNGSGEAPLNLSLKPTHSNHHTSSSLSSLSNMSANIGLDRISRRKPGPKPRRFPPTTTPPPLPPPPSHTNTPSSNLPPGAPSASLAQLFATAAAAAAASNTVSSGMEESLSRPSSRCDIFGNGGAGEFSYGVSSACNASMSSGAGGKDTRPRNLGRGVSKPKKNTVASLLAQSRALDPNASMSQQMSLLKSNILAAQQYIAEVGGDEKTLNKFLQDKFRGTLSDSSTVDASTDSDNLTDSNQTDSEMESTEMQSMKRSKQYDERALRVPLEKGWRRETIIRGITKNGAIRGDVIYAAPESSNKFKQMSDITQYLDYQKSKELSKENFTFSCRVILGDYIHMIAPEYSNDNEYIRMSEEDVLKRLDDLKTSMRTNIPVEQRIEVARRQQAARVAARLDREQARLTRELERSERQEAARRDKEARTQQIIEAKRKKQEEMDRQKQEEQQRKQQEKELKRQQNAIVKEQMYIQEVNKQRELLYTVELERERRRQHMTLVKALENRRKLEDRERKRQQAFAEKQANKEKRMEQRRVEMEILNEMRKPCEDLELEQMSLPEVERIPALKLAGKAFGDILMVFEFLHNFGETLGFDMDSLPTLDALQQALLVEEGSVEAEEELLSIMTHLIVCAIEDPGIPNPARHTTLLGQSLRSSDISHANLSEILRIYLYANATGEVKTLTGVSFERDREKRIADHHQTDSEMQSTQCGKNSAYYEKLHANATWKMADMLRKRPFLSLCPTNKAAILSFICNELLQNKAVIRQIDNSMETVAQSRKEKWILDAKARKLKMLYNKKIRTEAMERTNQTKIDGATDEIGSIESPALHKDDLLDDDETDMNMSENESVGTQPEEEEDAKLSADELGKKLEKAIKSADEKLNYINATNHQMRATCYGQDRFFRRYWSMPKAGGIFIEAMESADPSELILQIQEEQLRALDVKTLDDIDGIIGDVDEADINADNEVDEIIGCKYITESEPYKETIKEEHAHVNEDDEDHRKTPNRLENGKVDHKLIEMQPNIGEIIDTLNEYDVDVKKEPVNGSKITNEILVHKVEDAKSILSTNEADIEAEQEDEKDCTFSKLAEDSEVDDAKDLINMELKEDIKGLVLNDVKAESGADSETTENNDQYEYKWFSVFNKDGTCEGIQLCSGNKWDNAVGICTRDNVTELKIPVFPPSNSNAMYVINSCDSPAPLQITPEEIIRMEYIKEHGLPKPVERSIVPLNKRYGWWRVLHIDNLKDILANLHIRGARERELKRTLISTMQSMYEQPNKLYIEPGNSNATALCGFYNFVTNNKLKKQTEDLESPEADEKIINTEKHKVSFQLPTHIQSVPGLPDVPKPDSHDAWFSHVSQRIDMALLEQVEVLEDKVANASMQMKGWKIPNKYASETPTAELVQAAKDRLLSLEAAIERRYLKPPLGIIISDPNLVAIAQEAAAIATSSASTSNTTATLTTSTACAGGNLHHPAYLNAIPLAALTTTSAPILRSASPQHHLHVELTPSGGNLFCATPVLSNINNGPNSVAAALAQLDEVPKALTVWRDGVNRAQTSAQLAMCLYTLEASIAWDKSIMKAVSEPISSTAVVVLSPSNCRAPMPLVFNKQNARKYNSKLSNCQFCNSGDNEDKLLLCDSCDKGYHTYCFKPKIDSIPDGDWYCHECMNKAKGEKNCIVCGKKVAHTGTKLIVCDLCPRAYHTDCIRPNMSKAPRGKWYCSNCISKKPQKKATKKNCTKRDSAINNDSSELQAPVSPTLSHSSATTNEDISLTPQQHNCGNTNHRSLSPLIVTVVTSNMPGNTVAPSWPSTTVNTTAVTTPPRNPLSNYPPQQSYSHGESPTCNNTSISGLIAVGTSPQTSIISASISPTTATAPEIASSNSSSAASATLPISNSILISTKKDKATKKALKELALCRAILEDLECHDDAWPFLLPVNTKQFPTYKKIIKNPMDLSTIKKRLLDVSYKAKDDFSADVRQIFNNCETFNEDDSPVGKAGHCMRQFFEVRWNEHFPYTAHS